MKLWKVLKQGFHEKDLEKLGISALRKSHYHLQLHTHTQIIAYLWKSVCDSDYIDSLQCLVGSLPSVCLLVLSFSLLLVPPASGSVLEMWCPFPLFSIIFLPCFYLLLILYDWYDFCYFCLLLYLSLFPQMKFSSISFIPLTLGRYNFSIQALWPFG